MWIYLFIFVSFSSFADAELARTNAHRMVKNGELTEYHYYRMKTQKGSTVELYFTDDGVFKRAEGESPEKDELYIGKLGLSLAEALKLVQKKNLKPNEWELTEENGKWTYTFFEIRGPGDEKLIKVDALKGKVLE